MNECIHSYDSNVESQIEKINILKKLILQQLSMDYQRRISTNPEVINSNSLQKLSLFFVFSAKF